MKDIVHVYLLNDLIFEIIFEKVEKSFFEKYHFLRLCEKAHILGLQRVKLSLSEVYWMNLHKNASQCCAICQVYVRKAVYCSLCILIGSVLMTTK